MDYNVPRRGARTSEPQPTTTPSTPAPAPTVAQRSKSTKRSSDGSGMVKWAIVAVVVLAVLALAWFGWKQVGSSSSLIDRDKYQAVFLTNGQVYFGKLQNSSGDHLVLQKIFYLQASNTPADTSESKNPQEAKDQTSGDVQLIKLGTEVHGPTDEMVISREQVLFFENLKDDGNVSLSIKQYYEANKE